MKTTMKPSSSYFDSTSLIILPILFDHKPTEKEFVVTVAGHSGLNESSISAVTPKDPKSNAVWLAFPIDILNQHLFYVAFPSTKDNKKCWSIGMSNKGTMEDSLNVLSYTPDKLSNNPFGELLKDKNIEVIPLEQKFLDGCPEVARLLNLHKDEKLTSQAVQKHLEALWTVTQGSPCARCNRPQGCKLHVSSR